VLLASCAAAIVGWLTLRGAGTKGRPVG
jgi:hypothetical protein